MITAAVVASIFAYNSAANPDKGVLILTENKYDFGTISMANGTVNRDFEIKNDGQGELTINNIKTSCMCTTAVLEVNGEKSEVFAMHAASSPFWKMKLKPGETGKLTVTFDPNAHGPDATGPITREVTVSSDSDGKAGSLDKIVFTAEVTK